MRRTGITTRRGARRSLLPAALTATATAALLLVPTAGATAAGVVAAGTPDALAAGRFLGQQRAGYGPAGLAASRYEAAVAHAAGLPSAGRQAATAGSAAAGTWTPIGPTAIIGDLPKNSNSGFYAGPNSGRVDSLAVSSSGEIYAGTAGGGVWATADDGGSWTPLTDHEPTGLAIGALAVDPTNPAIVYAGTGEDNLCGDCLYGNGILKSTNGGRTWKVLNPGHVFTGVDFASLVVDPANDQDLFAGTSAGLFESTDGGATWKPPAGRFKDGPTWGVVLDPTTSPVRVDAAVYGVGIEQSVDGGRTFAVVGRGTLPPAATFGVTALGIGTATAAHPHADKTLYASVGLYAPSAPFGAGGVVYRSTDGGTTWTKLSAPAYTNQSYSYGGGNADQAFYDNTVAVDPADPDHVVVGGIALIDSTDGGGHWANVDRGHSFFGGTNVLHPDQHALAFDGSSVLVGDDGGVYEDNGATVANLNTNLDTGQFYEDLGVYDNGAQILGGLQDNGTALFTGQDQWSSTIAGDGGYNAINPLDPSEQFGEADEGLYATTDSWARTVYYIEPKAVYDGSLPPEPGGPDPALQANFVPPLTLVPDAGTPDQPTLYYGANNVYRSTNPLARQWTKITDHKGSFVSAIAVAPSDPAVMYVGFDDGTVLVSDNAASATPSFTDISSGVGQWVTHIAVDPGDAHRIAVTFSFSNTESMAEPPMVLTASVTTGPTPVARYTDVTGNLPTGVASTSVVYDRGDLVVATDVGVFATALSALAGSGTAWSSANTGLPNVQVIGLTESANGDLFAATHGRGVWKLTPPAT